MNKSKLKNFFTEVLEESHMILSYNQRQISGLYPLSYNTFTMRPLHIKLDSYIIFKNHKYR